MGFYNVVNAQSMQSGQAEDIGPVLSNFQAIAAVLNGGLDNSNIAPGANIDAAKVNLPADVSRGLVPIGGLLDYAGAGDPLGGFFLLADGRALSRSAYPALFTAIGATYGAGDGSTTFNLPDLRGRAAIGPDNMGTGAGAANRVATNKALGNGGGSETHVISAGEMPNHTHTASTGTESADHSHSGTTSPIGDHNHSSGLGGQNELVVAGQTGDNQTQYSTQRWGTDPSTNAVQRGISGTSLAGAHSHTFGTGGRSTPHTHSVTVDSTTGGGNAVNIMSPYQVLNKLIRVL